MLQYLEGKRYFGNYFTCRGSGVHASRKENFRQKIKSRVDLPVEDLLDAARDEINRRFDEGDMDPKDEKLVGKPEKRQRGIIIDDAIPLAKIDRQQLQIQIQPIEVEKTHKVVLSDWPFDIQLTMDSADEGDTITDLKTSSRKWNPDRPHDEYQPAVYALGFKAYFGRPLKRFNYHIVSMTAKLKKCSAQNLPTQVPDSRVLAVLKRFGAMHKAIEAGIFNPCEPRHWKCSQKWCGFWHECKYVDGGKRKDV
jgi:hypothetical protein